MGTVGLLGVMAAGMGAVLAGRTLARYKDAAMRPLLLFRPFTLVRRTTISDPAATFPVVRFRFAIGGTGLDGFNLGLGDHVKLARGDVWTKPKSYSPLAWGVGGSDDAGDTFDLVVKIYPRNGTSQYLDSMQVGVYLLCSLLQWLPPHAAIVFVNLICVPCVCGGGSLFGRILSPFNGAGPDKPRVPAGGRPSQDVWPFSTPDRDAESAQRRGRLQHCVLRRGDH